MDHLRNILDSALKKQLPPNKLVALAISRKLKEYGVTLRDDQFEKLESDLSQEHLETLGIDFDDDQEATLKPYRDSNTGKLKLNIDDRDVSSLQDDLEKAVSNLILEEIDTLSKDLLQAWKDQAATILDKQRVVRSEFENKIREIWGSAIDLLEMLIGVCQDAGSEFNQQYCEEASANNDYMFEALTRLHARACQTALEILTLLKGGFADGAMARWRTLHEIAVIGMFIHEHGISVAERFLDHIAVENYDDAVQYQTHCKTLGFELLSEEEINELKSDNDEVCRKYGKGFEKDYGWAVRILHRGAPTFVEIEQNVNLQHFRPFYKLGNINIHAGSRGVIFRLGLPPSGDQILVAGPSVFGLADPGQNTAISLMQITGALLLSKPSLDREALAMTTHELVTEIFKEFAKANEWLEQSTDE